MTADVKAAVDAAFREEWGRVVAALIRVTGDPRPTTAACRTTGCG